MNFLFLILILLINGDTTKKLSKTPLKKNAVKITHLFTIDGGEEGFYERISSTMNDEGKILIYDHGNFLAYVYDKDGKQISSFGKEGSGPGEFAKWTQPKDITNDYAVFRMWNKIQFFKLDGTFIGEAKENTFSAEIKYNKESFTLNYRKNEFDFRSKEPEFLSKTVKYTGQLISSKKNPKYKVPKKQEGWDPSKFIDNMNSNYVKPRGKRSFAGGEIQYYQGSYKIEFIKGNNKTVITRPYDRIKDLPREEPKDKRGGEMRAKIDKTLLNLTKGIQSDVSYFLGNSDNYLFVKTSENTRKEINCDIISDKLEFYSRFEHKESDQITRSYIKFNKFFVHLKSDDIGPYMKVYKLDIN